MNRKQLFAWAGALLLASGLASAESGGGFYVGGGLYNAQVNDTVVGSLNDNDATAAVFVGYRPIEMLGVEAGYYDLGNYSDSSFFGTSKFDAKALSLAGVLTFDMGPIGVYGKAGLAYVDWNASWTAPGIAYKWGDKSTDPFAAIGVSFDIWDTLYLYAEYQHIQSEVDIDMAGVGVRFDF